MFKFFPPSLFYKTPAEVLKKFAFIIPQAWEYRIYGLDVASTVALFPHQTLSIFY
jgi:hypothetical protein